MKIRVENSGMKAGLHTNLSGKSGQLALGKRKEARKADRNEGEKKGTAKINQKE